MNKLEVVEALTRFKSIIDSGGSVMFKGKIYCSEDMFIKLKEVYIGEHLHISLDTFDISFNQEELMEFFI